MVTAQEFLHGCNKQASARVFMELLQMKMWNLIELKQDQPFEDINLIRAIQSHTSLK